MAGFKATRSTRITRDKKEAVSLKFSPMLIVTNCCAYHIFVSSQKRLPPDEITGGCCAKKVQLKRAFDLKIVLCLEKVDLEVNLVKLILGCHDSQGEVLTLYTATVQLINSQIWNDDPVDNHFGGT